jgi:hypothetical protein
MVQAFTISGVNLSPSRAFVIMIRAGNRILRWYVGNDSVLILTVTPLLICSALQFFLYGVLLKYSPDIGTTWRGDFGLPDVAPIQTPGIVMPGNRLDRYDPFKKQKSDDLSDREQVIFPLKNYSSLMNAFEDWPRSIPPGMIS